MTGWGSKRPRSGECSDNAVVESFFASRKTELVPDARWETRREAKSAVVSWIEGWYNRERMHSTLGYMSLVEYETQIGLSRVKLRDGQNELTGCQRNWGKTTQ